MSNKYLMVCKFKLTICALIAFLAGVFLTLAAVDGGCFDIIKIQLTRPETQQIQAARGTGAWFSGVVEMDVADSKGQVYSLEQAEPNSNLYTVFRMRDETNGLSKPFEGHSYRPLIPVSVLSVQPPATIWVSFMVVSNAQSFTTFSNTLIKIYE